MFKTISSSVFLKAFGFLLGFIIHIGLARMIGTQEYGVFNFIFAIISILALFCTCGFPVSLSRLIPQTTLKEPQLVHWLIRFSQQTTFVLSVLVSLLFYYIFDIFFSLEKTTISAAILLTVFWSVLRVHIGALNGLKYIKLSVFFDAVWRDLLLCCVVLMSFLMIDMTIINNASHALLWLSLICFIGIIISGAIINHHPLSSLSEAQSIPSSKVEKQWMFTSLPMMLVSGIRLLMLRTDLIIIGFLLGPLEAGIYAAAIKFAGLVALPQMAIIPYFSPHAAEYHAQNSHKQLEKLFMNAMVLQSCGGFVMFIALIFMMPYIFAYMGNDFNESFHLLIVLGFAQILGISCGPAANTLIMTGHEKILVKILSLAAIINIPATYIAVDSFGMLGAAVVTGIIFIIQSIMPLAYIWHKKIIG